MSPKIGDVVKLKSGGVAMTVVGRGGDTLGGLTLSWFVGNELKTTTTEAAALRVIDDAELAKDREF